MSSTTINSLAELVDAIKFIKSSNSGTMWFRGQSNSEWNLLPSLLRTTTNISEGTLYSKFRQNCFMILDKIPNNYFEWMFLMQHYGAPTRLLDWSESPLVSLYFSVENYENHSKKDGALWCLWPTILNKNANINDPVEENFIPHTDEDVIKSYAYDSLNANTRINLHPVAILANRNNPRIHAQMGTFTIHHNGRDPIDQIGSNEHIKKFIIPIEAKKNIHEELRLLGITRFNLFPELTSLGESIKELTK